MSTQRQRRTPPQNVTSFRVDVPQAKLDRIRQQVQLYEWHTAPATGGWRYGADQEYMKRLTAHWLNEYDWREAEREINRFQHFTVDIDGERMHFIYEIGSGKNSTPLLLLHGWPYSFHSFLNIIEPLAHPERSGGNADDGYDVIVPSLPGFVFSEAPPNPIGGRGMARRFQRLMTDVLGYERYVVQGGDIGAVTGDWLALDYPQSISGLHETLLGLRHEGADFGSGETGSGQATAAEREFVRREKENVARGGAYSMVQRTRPETLSFAVNGSPVGAAAWIIEKYYFWADKRERAFEQIFLTDDLLTNVMLYLVTDSFNTAVWSYASDEPSAVPFGKRIEVPVGFAAFPDPYSLPPPRSFAARTRSNIMQWTEMPRGGHFPFQEQPQLFVEDVRKFGRLVR